ncbi:hypothetical protein ACOI22_03335 [Glaciecola sp. 2405UD65-10]|uniref:hypothetical protein n=1 Tax=Glaciecola sp. 2405UD65-10 TaxID=3397244 RepID=UPI003B58DC24
MAKSVLAELVTKMTVESSQFKKELEKTTAKTAAFGKSQTKAANDSVFGSKKMSQAFRQAANSASTLQGPMGGIASRLSTIASGFSAVGVAGVATGLAISGLAVTMGVAVAKFAAMEKRLLRTEALFKATSGAAGLTTSELSDLANEVAENTLASVAGTTAAINVLQTFKSVSGDTFTSAINLSQDLAAVMGSDIKTAALQLGKALEEPLVGLTALRRSGVSFSAAQKEVIKDLVETGRTAEAQKIILDTLERQVGGAGAAEGAGLSGAVDLLGQRWDEMLESLAKTTGVGTATTSALNAIAGGLENISGIFDSLDSSNIDTLNSRLDFINDRLADNAISESARKALAAEKAGIDAQLAAYKQKEDEQTAIIKEGERLREDARKQALAAKLKAEQDAGATTLDALNNQLGTENEKIISQWESRNELIEGLVLSEAEIQSQGYATLLDLQQDYLEKSSALAADQMFDVEEKKRQQTQNMINAELQASQSMQQSLMNNAAALAGSIATMSEEGSKAQKVAFVAQQAIALASTFISTEMAAIAALAPPPIGLGPVAGAPYSVAIRAMGYTSMGLIAAQTIAGAREMGGPVSGGKTYLVGEKGPELFTPGATGQITSNDNLQKSIGSNASPTVHLNLSVNSRRPNDIMDEINSIKKPMVRMLQSAMSTPI